MSDDPIILLMPLPLHVRSWCNCSLVWSGRACTPRPRARGRRSRLRRGGGVHDDGGGDKDSGDGDPPDAARADAGQRS
jgi:hypothetical protein